MKVTVLVPTHHHPRLIPYALRSACRQTVKDLEILVVGDGICDETVKAVQSVQDERIQLFVYPKGLRHGELHRHKVLMGAKGDIVCYLADDDLWLPDHLKTMMDGLKGAEDEFHHTRPVLVMPDGTFQRPEVDLRKHRYRSMMLDGVENRVPFSCAGHRRSAYMRLPFGWRTTPAGTHTDLYMWQQFLANTFLRECSSSSRVTVVHLPSVFRKDATMDRREEEIRKWFHRDPEDARITLAGTD